MKDTQSKSNGSLNQIGVISPMMPGEFKWVYSEVKNNHTPKHTKRNLPIKMESTSNWCVVCGGDSQIGSNFCSIACMKDQYGV